MAEVAGFREFAARVNDGSIVFPADDVSSLNWTLRELHLQSTFSRGEDGAIKLNLAEADLTSGRLDCLTLAYHLSGPAPPGEAREDLIAHVRKVDTYLKVVNPILQKHRGYTFRRRGRQLHVATTEATYFEEEAFAYLNDV